MKNIIYTTIAIGFLVAAQQKASAQQEVLYTQYADVQMYTNPAYAGGQEVLNITGIHRQQWVGIDGAPQTTNLLAHMPLANFKLGVGLDIMSDKLGPLSRTTASGNFAYHLQTNETNQLSFGLKATYDQYKGNESSLRGAESDVLGGNTGTQGKPNVGFGVYYRTPKYFVGASSPRLLTHKLDAMTAATQLKRHAFVIAGGLFTLNDTWKLRPTLQVRATENAPISADISAAMIYNDKLWLGLFLRPGSMAGLYAQYQINRQFKVGYAYDAPVSLGFKNTSGSHEIMLSYDFSFIKEGLVSPRFF